MSIATVCRALDLLEGVGRIYAQFCIKTNKAFSNNSYFFLITCSAAPEPSNVISLDWNDYRSAFPQPYCACACSCRQQNKPFLSLALMMRPGRAAGKHFQGLGVF
ncbi:MAG: hypothetical protein AAGU02_06325 [Lawsonibacter sp.]